ncbi:MAG: hypothetical protein CVT88_06125 [Candidatus Altiarchaeales archaeon HGW-Altiarchaeales-1]|nr:MAG: hypothetical protein CVT88_06125 [Candidatus Altiarchaeales archaeon HGW-Altiarchaeales-1]
MSRKIKIFDFKKAWNDRIERKNIIMFILAVALGLVLISLAITSKCMSLLFSFGYLGDLGKNCDVRIPIDFVILVLLVLIYEFIFTEHTRIIGVWFANLQERWGGNMIVFSYFASVGFFGGILQYLMPHSTIPVLVFGALFMIAFIYSLIPISWLKKIKKI